jgi:carboxylate-amine ligase
VILRRTAEERLRTDAGGLTALGDALLDPLKAGTVAVVNAFGTGVADDKRVYPYVEDLIRFFCDEEPLLRSVPTLELARADHLAEALERMDELVFKPRSGSGGHGLCWGIGRRPPSARN